jgi:hypothetical protein
MPTIGLYTATENELGAVGRAAERVGADVVARSESDLDGADGVVVAENAIRRPRRNALTVRYADPVAVETGEADITQDSRHIYVGIGQFDD